MAVSLIFHGGLFTVLPGSGSARRIDVHMCRPEGVEVVSEGGRRLNDLENVLGSARRLDFESQKSLRPDCLPIRRVSHLLPIDYHGFHKTVSFSGGAVSGEQLALQP